ncbi:Adipocyte plasma membrane-associated protein [Clonorchis sinensis]|uniref:Adipocyte plasma membrane-associated protein n=1 Tax=Clonorchis sinensis TaxID=79923 RepID=A0A8T1MKB3_CLOSI|nr:Adipocyte plasma membrane-associated protein [Clonorchis sinensis]
MRLGFRLIWSAVLTAIASCVAYFFYDTYSAYSNAPEIKFPNEADVSNKLTNLEFLSTLPYHGCESLVYCDGALYMGAVEGRILKMNDSGLHVLAQFGDANCASSHTCGRPLGMRLSLNHKELIVADTHLGLFSVSLIDGTHKKLFPLDDTFKVTCFNDFDILPNGTVILSETSTEFPMDDIMNIIFSARPSGRILSIDLATGEWHQLMGGLAFPNGVQLHRDGESVLVADSVTSRIHRVPLDGSPPTLFGGELPGMPDNIRASPRGGYWVPVANLKDTFISHLMERTRQTPALRWIPPMLVKLPILERMRLSKSAMLLRLNDDGEVIEVLRDPTNRVRNVAEVCEHDNVIYTSTYFLPHIGRLHL